MYYISKQKANDIITSSEISQLLDDEPEYICHLPLQYIATLLYEQYNKG